MCIGIPLRLAAVDGLTGRTEDGAVVDLSLIPDLRPGDWILGFLGTARRRLDPDEAAGIRAALTALAAAMDGERDDGAFADLTGREPTLPPHLEAARAAGLTEA
ncbi:HypC/HybG/HupF family hydrogenase formation chaperone [Azospirillum picis]|uniref:Hydrogenase expression/formation protein HypC n=1 Tax=Azospirillum picis TaxID=488438 RepID=A0ABU0MLF8_9PROT|nr:HypC/HybG/HupF family hydrogenase formation chaperone [Azospirillum picis]MBP2301070.1 hydrogenase expression/formation protein HypC [Azospirillum picis]MDQ0534310.1 hydrogenase expression/formation protein HypC [Azospirillum picis]